MATPEFIQKRIASKKKEIQKLQKKLARIQKAKDSGWKNNPYFYDEDELNRTLYYLDAANEALQKYCNELDSMKEKAASRNIPVILEFLEMWKEKCRDFYRDTLPEYIEDLKDFVEKKKVYDDFMSDLEDRTRPYYWLHLPHDNPRYQEGKTVAEDFKTYKKNFNAAWADFVSYLVNSHTEEPQINWDALNSDLDREANRKYDYIIDKTNAIVGKITDASGLYIGKDGNLNGVIIGDRGTAKVETIGAGGYNIQCYHFRTLIHEYKKVAKMKRSDSFAR